MSDDARLSALRELLAEDPADAFTRYAVAMQLKGLGRAEEALSEFARLLEGSPDYVACYYHYAALLEQQGDEARAREVIELGLAAAARAGDDHAHAELEDLRDDLFG